MKFKNFTVVFFFGMLIVACKKEKSSQENLTDSLFVK